MASARPESDRLLDMIEAGELDPNYVVLMFVKYMSEDDVADMMDVNELSPRFFTEEDEED